MSEICIPIPDLKNGQKAEITVNMINSDDVVSYRVETFSGNDKKRSNNNLNDYTVFSTFKQFIDNYDKKWELLQVLASQEDHSTIKLLYRKR